MKSKKDAYMSFQSAHFHKTEVRVEEGFEVTFGKLLRRADWEAKVIN